MGKTIAIYQPAFIPWLGYFAMFYEADIFVFYDDVQYTVRDWRNRNRIRTPSGWTWLTIPVEISGKSYRDFRIIDVKISNTGNWRYKHLKTLSHFYKKSKFFDEIYEFVEKVYLSKQVYLVDFVYEIFFEIVDYLGSSSKKRVFFSHEMEIPKNLHKTDRLLYIIDSFFSDVKVYITGPKAKNYLETEKFSKRGIKVKWFEYFHPYYRQLLWGSNVFITHLSILDLLFNHGKDSLDILLHRKIIQKPPYIEMINADSLKKR